MPEKHYSEPSFLQDDVRHVDVPNAEITAHVRGKKARIKNDVLFKREGIRRKFEQDLHDLNFSDESVARVFFLDENVDLNILDHTNLYESFCRVALIPWLLHIRSQYVRIVDAQDVVILHPVIINSTLTYDGVSILLADFEGTNQWIRTILTQDEADRVMQVVAALGAVYGKFSAEQDSEGKRRNTLRTYLSESTLLPIPHLQSLAESVPEELRQVDQLTPFQKNIIDNLLEFHRGKQVKFAQVLLTQSRKAESAWLENTKKFAVDGGDVQAIRSADGLALALIAQAKAVFSFEPLQRVWSNFFDSSVEASVDARQWGTTCIEIGRTPGRQFIFDLRDRFNQARSVQPPLIRDFIFEQFPASLARFYPEISAQRLALMDTQTVVSTNQELFQIMELMTILSSCMKSHSLDPKLVSDCKEMINALALYLEQMRGNQKKTYHPGHDLNPEVIEEMKKYRRVDYQDALERLHFDDGILSQEDPTYLEYVNQREQEVATMLHTTSKRIHAELDRTFIRPELKAMLLFGIEGILSYVCAFSLTNSEVFSLGASLLVPSLTEMIRQVISKSVGGEERRTILQSLKGISTTLTDYIEAVNADLQRTGKRQRITALSLAAAVTVALSGVIIHTEADILRSQPEQRYSTWLPAGSMVEFAVSPPSDSNLTESATQTPPHGSESFGFLEQVPELGEAFYHTFVNDQMQRNVHFWVESTSEIQDDGSILTLQIERANTFVPEQTIQLDSMQELRSVIEQGVADGFLFRMNDSADDMEFGIPIGWQPHRVLRVGGDPRIPVQAFWDPRSGLHLTGEVGERVVVMYTYTGQQNLLVGANSPIPDARFTIPDGYVTAQEYFASVGNEFAAQTAGYINDLLRSERPPQEIAGELFTWLQDHGYDYGLSNQTPPTGNIAEMLSQLYALDADGNPVYPEMVCANFAYIEAGMIEFASGGTIQTYLITGHADAGRQGGQGYTSQRHRILIIRVGDQFFAFDGTLPDANGNLGFYPSPPETSQAEIDALFGVTEIQPDTVSATDSESATSTQESARRSSSWIQTLLGGAAILGPLGGIGAWKLRKKFARRGEQHKDAESSRSPIHRQAIEAISEELHTSVPRAIDTASQLVLMLCNEVQQQTVYPAGKDDASHLIIQIQRMLRLLHEEELPYSSVAAQTALLESPYTTQNMSTQGVPRDVSLGREQMVGELRHFEEKLGSLPEETIKRDLQDLQNYSFAFMDNTISKALPALREFRNRKNQLSDSQKAQLDSALTTTLLYLRNELKNELGHVNDSKIRETHDRLSIKRRYGLAACIAAVEAYSKAA